MNYANQQSQGVAGNAPKDLTINERLNRSAEGLMNQCDRIESVLSRINGTPPTPSTSAQDRLGNVETIQPTASLVMVVERLEAAKERLTNLALGVERIA